MPDGLGTALKPAFEPVVVARKPLVGTVAQNVLAYGTGAINVEAGRIGTEGGRTVHTSSAGEHRDRWEGNKPTGEVTFNGGRWPANVALDSDSAAALDQMSGTLTSGAIKPYTASAGDRVYGHGPDGKERVKEYAAPRDVGGASRFFLTAEPDAPDLPIDELAERFMYCAKAPKSERPVVDGVSHPTVKPLSLLRWLVRLVTPPGGTVLEPFAGSGTTVEAAILEGLDVIAIEREADYLPLIQARIFRAQAVMQAAADNPGPEQLELFADEESA